MGAAIAIVMEREHGSLHLLRKFQNRDGSHVFDVMWTSSERLGPVDNPVIRRFSSEPELKKDMRGDPVEVEDLMPRFDRVDRVVIPDLQYSHRELKQFRLAA